MKKKSLFIILGIILFLTFGGTLAYYLWGSSINALVNARICAPSVVFVGGNTINGNNIRPVTSYDMGLSKEINVNLSNLCDGDAALMTLKMELYEFPEGLADASFKWELYKEDEKISDGNFVGKQQDDIIVLANNQIITGSLSSYILYIYLDGNMENPTSTQEQGFIFKLYSEGTGAVYNGSTIVNNVRLLDQTGGALETEPSSYTDDTTSMFVTLPGESSITYEVEILNLEEVDVLVKTIDELSNTNSNIDISIGLNVNDHIDKSSSKKFNITLTNNTQEEQEGTLILNYTFEELGDVIVTFNPNGGSVNTKKKIVTYNGTYGDLPTPTRKGYTFIGWRGNVDTIPDEYQEIEYIEATGTQYIDTGVSMNGDYTLYADGFMTPGKLGVLISGYHDTNNRQGVLFYTVSNKYGYYWFGKGYTENKNLTSIGINLNQRFQFTQDKNGITLIQGNLSSSDTYIGNSTTHAQNIYLFETAAKTEDCFGTLYRAKIMNGSEVIRDFLPCYRKSDDEVGMYDIVNGVFYTNANTDADATSFADGNSIMITSSTAVKNGNDHTLYAVWEKNNS